MDRKAVKKVNKSDFLYNLNFMKNELEFELERGVNDPENVKNKIETVRIAEKYVNAWDKVVHELEIMAHFDGTCKASYLLNIMNNHLGEIET